MTPGALGFWWFFILENLEFGEEDGLGILTLVKNTLGIFGFGDFEAGEISLVI